MKYEAFPLKLETRRAGSLPVLLVTFLEALAFEIRQEDEINSWKQMLKTTFIITLGYDCTTRKSQYNYESGWIKVKNAENVIPFFLYNTYN